VHEDKKVEADSLADEAALRSHGQEILWPCTSELLRLATSENLPLAKSSVHSLGQIGDNRILETLLSLLETDDLAEEAVVALSKIDHPEVPVRLLALLSGAVPKVTAACAAVLWRFANDEVVHRLAPLVKAPYSHIRKAAIESLGNMGLADVLPPLFDALSDSDEEIVIASLKALRHVKVGSPDQLIPKLSALYESIDNPRIRATVVQVFMGLAGADMLSLAKKALKDANPRVRANAVELIGAMPIADKLKVVILKQLFRDGENNRVLANVAIALGKADTATSIQILSKLLNSPEKWERASAVYAARFIQSDRVTSWLTTQFTSESDPDVLRNIIESLSFLPGPEVTCCFIRALSHDNPLIRIGAAKSLGRIGEVVGEEHLLKLLDRETDPSVICEVVSALGRIADSSRIPALSRFLQHTDLRVQANSIEALTNIGSVEIVPCVEPFLNSSDNRVKANAAVACWACGSLNVVEELARMLENPNLKQKLSAVYAIGEIGGSLSNLSNVRKYLLLISALREDLKRPPATAQDHLGSGGVSFAREIEAEPAREPADSSEPGRDLPPRLEEPPVEPAWEVPVPTIEEVLSKVGAGLLDDALIILKGALQNDPKNPYLLFMTAEVHRRKGDKATACKVYERLHSVDPEFINSHLLLASLHTQSHEIDQSLFEYFSALKVQLSLIMTQVDLGLALLREAKSTEASLLLKGLVGQFAIDSRLHFKAGKEYLRNRRASIGLDHLVKAYLVAPNTPETLMNLSVALVDLGRWRDAKLLVARLQDLCGSDPTLGRQIEKLRAVIVRLEANGGS